MALADARTEEAPMIAAKFDVAVVGTGPVGLAAALGFGIIGTAFENDEALVERAEVLLRLGDERLQ